MARARLACDTRARARAPGKTVLVSMSRPNSFPFCSFLSGRDSQRSAERERVHCLYAAKEMTGDTALSSHALATRVLYDTKSACFCVSVCALFVVAFLGFHVS